jgi:hypothetical protein
VAGALCLFIIASAISRSPSTISPRSSVRRQNSRSSVEPRRNDNTTGRVILPSRKSSPTFLPSLAAEPP